MRSMAMFLLTVTCGPTKFYISLQASGAAIPFTAVRRFWTTYTAVKVCGSGSQLRTWSPLASLCETAASSITMVFLLTYYFYSVSHNQSALWISLSVPCLRCLSFPRYLLRGVFMGRKESATAYAAKLSAILPLPAVLQVIDVLLARMLTEHIDKALHHVDDTFIGARPLTQTLDIAHGVQFVIEKCLDDKSQGGVAQMDVEKYYDSLDGLLICRWLEGHGVPRSICACALRHQILPQVRLCAGSACVPIPYRTIGTLTGSRVAGALGRIPVEATISDRALH